MEYGHCNRREHRQGNRFLDDFQLHQAEWPAVDAAPDVVCGNHETVLQERNAPRGENHENQRPVGADVHFFELEVAVPSESHKDVGTAEKKNCKNTSFHNLFLVSLTIRFSRRHLVGEALAHLFEILDVIFTLVVAIRPVKSVEMPILEV